MLPLGTALTAVAPGQWMVARTPDAKAAVIVAFPGVTTPEDAWAQLERWTAAMHALNIEGTDVPVPLRLPDGVPRIAYGNIPWRVGSDGLPAVPTSQQVIEVLLSLARTLDALHVRNIVHGALGLGSLWWQSAEVVHLPDVGLAHVLDGLVPMPPIAAAYHAPEVWRGASPSPASDQYALAVIALELFTGTPRNAVSDVEGIVAFEPVVVDPHLTLFRGGSRGMYAVFQRALAATPSARFSSCTAFVEALQGHVEPVQSLRTIHLPLHRFRQRITTRRVGFTALAVTAIAAAIVVARTPSTPSQIAESVTERLPGLGSVETILEGGASSRPSGGDAFGSRQRGGTVTERERVGGGGPERLTVDPEVSSIRTSSSGTVAPSDGGGDAPGTGPRVMSANGTGATGSLTDVARSPSTIVPNNPLPDSSSGSARVGEAISGAVSTIVRAVTGTSAPLTGERAAASADLARGGTIRLDVPRGSRVYLDGVLLSGTPTIVTATPGPHDVDILLPGTTVPQRRRITVVATDTTVVRLRAP